MFAQQNKFNRVKCLICYNSRVLLLPPCCSTWKYISLYPLCLWATTSVLSRRGPPAPSFFSSVSYHHHHHSLFMSHHHHQWSLSFLLWTTTYKIKGKFDIWIFENSDFFRVKVFWFLTFELFFVWVWYLKS